MKSFLKFNSLFLGIVLGILVSSVFSQTFQSPAYANEQNCATSSQLRRATSDLATSSELRRAVSDIKSHIIMWSD